MHFTRMLFHLLRSRRRPAQDIWDGYSLPLRVLPSEIDIFMHVNNGMYFSIMDLGRIDLMVRSGVWNALRGKGWSGVVSAETISFRKSLKLGQRYSVETKIIGIDERAVYFEHRIVVDGEIYARAFVATRLLSENGTVSKDEAIKVFGPPPEGLELPEWIHDWRLHNSLPSSRRPASHSWA